MTTHTTRQPVVVSPDPRAHRPLHGSALAEDDRRAARAQLRASTSRTYRTSSALSAALGSSRLVQHKAAADDPAYWDLLWRANPGEPMTGRRILKWYQRLFRTYLPRSHDRPIVEAGCGNGNMLRTIANEGYRVEGVDFAPLAIDANRALDPVNTYLVADVRELPYDDDSLGGYVSLGVVEHFPDDQRRVILDEARRVLRPGAPAFVSVPFKSPLRRARAAAGGYDALPSEPGLPFYQNVFSVSEIARDIERAGLRVIDLDYYDAAGGFSTTTGLGQRFFDGLASRSRALARHIDHPPRWVRALSAHMVMCCAIKPR